MFAQVYADNTQISGLCELDTNTNLLFKLGPERCCFEKNTLKIFH